MKKEYIIPVVEMSAPEIVEDILQLSAPGTGIHDGGEGDDEDDPTVKEREEEDKGWGGLW